MAAPKEERKDHQSQTCLFPSQALLVGRKRSKVVKLVGKNRLVTLAGSGGVGKARLAIQAANRLLHKSRDGVWWVDLVGWHDDALIRQAVAQAAGVRGFQTSTLVNTLSEHFRTRQILLVLDNCEQDSGMCTACRSVAQHLFKPKNPDNEPRRIGSGPVSRSGMYQRFHCLIQFRLCQSTHWRAMKVSACSWSTWRAIRSGFSFDRAQLIFVVRVCQRLDGIPLAIELANGPGKSAFCGADRSAAGGPLRSADKPRPDCLSAPSNPPSSNRLEL